MASFTSEIQGFNPYISQLPIDEYVRVGLQEQSEYDMGVQKVQSYIDSVAGLDVINDAQKQYLQTRIGELQTGIKKVTAADFSNQQLIHQIGGATKKIASDPIIQKAVSSTARYRKGLQDIEEARKAGKYSPSNEYVFMNQANSYINSPDANSSFSGSYVPYTDYKKKILDIVKEVTGDSSYAEYPFTIGPDGKVTFNDVMSSRKIEGKSREKIINAVNSQMTEADLQQMQIDGMFEYRGYDKNKMKEVFDNSSQSYLQTLQDKREVLQRKLIGDPNNTDLQDQIKALELQQNEELASYRKSIEFLDKDPEAFKSSWYARNFMKQTALAFSSDKEEIKYEVSPYFKVWKDKEDLRFKAEELLLSKERLKIERERLANEKEKKKKEEAGDFDFVTTAPSQEGDEGKASESDVISQVSKLQGQIDAAKAIVFQNPNYVGMTEADYEEKKDLWKKGQLKDEDLIRHFEGTGQAQQKKENLQAVLAGIKQKADNTAGLNISDVTKNLKGVRINGQDFTAEELATFNSKLDVILKKQPSVTFGPTMRGADVTDVGVGKLSDKEKVLFNIYKQKSNTGSKPLTIEEQRVYEYLHNIRENVNSKIPGILEKRQTFVDEELAKVNTAFGTNTAFFTMNKAEQRQSALAKIKALMDFAARTGKENTNPDFSFKAIADAISEDPQSQVSLDFKPESVGSPERLNLRIFTPKGRKTIPIDLTRQQATDVLKGDPFSDPFRDTEMQLVLGNGTTNVRGQGRLSAWLQPNHFGKTQKYGVSGDLVRSVSTPGAFNLILYVTNKETGKEDKLQYPKLVTREDISTGWLANITDTTVDKIYELQNQKK